MLITMLLTVALLAGGSVMLGMQLKSSRSAGLVKQKITSEQCAEAGIVAGRGTVASNYGSWTGSLCNQAPPLGTGSCVIGSAASEPAWLNASVVDHDLDDNGTSDFVLTLIDNVDEVPPAANDPAKDNDLQVWVISTCTTGDITTQVRELVKYTPGNTCYQAQLGGCGGGGNSK